MNELLDEIKLLKEENERLRMELAETKEHLKKYTAPANMKKYYENHKEEIKQRVRDHKEKTGYKPSAEQKKEYNRQAYLKRKEKLKEQNLENI